ARNNINNKDEYIKFISLFAINNGIFYYEAIILDGGKIHLGWTTKFNKEYYLQIIGENSKFRNVIGCLFDTTTRQFVFYLNGKEVKSDKENPISCNAYYISVQIGDYTGLQSK